MPQETATKEPLTLEQYSEERNLPANYLVETWGLKTVLRDGISCVEQPYIRMDGTVCAPRYRFANAKQSPYKSGDSIVLYGQKQLLSLDDGAACTLVEGESDTQTLHYFGSNVLGIPGTSMWDTCIKNDPAILEFLTGRKIIVFQEPPSLAEKQKRLDSASKMLANIQRTLPLNNVVVVKLWELAPKDDDGEPLYKDVSGLWMHYQGVVGLPAFMEALVNACKAAEKRCTDTRRIVSVLASDVEMELTRWLWYNHIPIGELTVFAGMPGKGKSTAARDVIARLTNGKDFPDSVRQVDTCEVAVLASEESLSKIVVPGLTAAGAARENVRLLKSTSDGTQEWEIALDDDLGRLRLFLQEHSQVKLIVIDPVTSYIGEIDPNRPKEVRPFLNKLKKFAEENGVGILLIMHLSKNPDVSALHRVGGAATWIEVPRSVWFFDVKKRDENEDKTEPPTYVMLNGKLNIIADEKKKSLGYTFSGVDVEIEGVQANIGVIQWGEETDITLEQQFQTSHERPGPEPKKVDAAMLWLHEYLKDGQKYATDVFSDGEQAGHADNTLRKAKDRLSIKPEREFPNKGRWVWSLPA